MVNLLHSVASLKHSNKIHQQVIDFLYNHYKVFGGYLFKINEIKFYLNISFLVTNS